MRSVTSCLPDDAAGVFAPGWDVSTDKNDARCGHRTSPRAHGLGSPFPEDSKLCAALSTFWPAVAPDITRSLSTSTGNTSLRHTVAPLTDEEIGQAGVLPWDGIAGPQLRHDRRPVTSPSARAFCTPTTQAALDRRFTSRLVARVTSGEYQRRILAMAFTYVVAGGNSNLLFVLVQATAAVRRRAPEGPDRRVDDPARCRLPNRSVSPRTRRANVSPTNFRKRLPPVSDRRLFMVDPKNRIVLQRRFKQPLWSRLGAQPVTLVVVGGGPGRRRRGDHRQAGRHGRDTARGVARSAIPAGRDASSGRRAAARATRGSRIDPDAAYLRPHWHLGAMGRRPRVRAVRPRR